MPKEKIILIYVQDFLGNDEYHKGYVPEDLNIPLGILYLGTYLNRYGFDILLLDTRLYKEDNFFKFLYIELIKDPLLVGLSVMTPSIRNALKITRFIKSYFKKIYTVWGGVHPTLYPDSTIRNENIDFLIVNEGEKSLLSLARYLRGNINKIGSIPNLVFIYENQIIKNEVSNPAELKDIGIPDYKILDIDRYTSRLISHRYIRRQIEVITSRGCIHRCAFCINSVINNKYRDEPIEQTLKNIDILINDYNIEHIFFMDEDFFINRNKIRYLLPELKKRKISWESNCRADYINPSYIDNKFLKEIKESGCIKLRMGLESGSQKILDLLDKDITIQKSMEAVKSLTKYGILPSASFMMGMPEEELIDIIKTLKLILKLYMINPKIEIIGPLIFRPYPGGKLFLKCQEEGLRIPQALDEWSDFYIHNLLEEYRYGLPWFSYSWIFKKVYLFLGYLRLVWKRKLFRYLSIPMIKFHIITKLKFINVDYAIYKCIKKIKSFFNYG
ncbi:MAG: B12-binding domain-containing radical SAM protein [Candidatus Omnitrophica bacterium]|nr:B12-binding domain-containing radical SAM protein [Candidatus Omnitrophota bacterium]